MVFYFVALYGLYTVQDRIQMWENLKVVMSSNKEPLFCMRDFNLILKSTDRPHGSAIQDMKFRDFNEFVTTTVMAELRTIGSNYKWTNGRTYNKIDKALVNVAWMVSMPTLEVNVLRPSFSDHSSLSLDIGRLYKNTYRNFRFF